MHILLISRSFPHHRQGGLEWHSQDIVEGLMEAGHTVSVVTTPLPDQPALKALKVNGNCVELGGTAAAYDLRFVWSAWRELSSIVRRLKPDLIHAQGFAGVAVEEAGVRCPLVTTIHGTLWSETLLAIPSAAVEKVSDPFEKLRLMIRYRNRYFFAPIWRRFLRRTRWLLVDSRFSRQALLREAGRIRSHPIVVPLGFDPDRYPMVDRAEARTSLGLDEETLLAFAVGRLEKAKGVEQVLESFLAIHREFSNLRLVMGGTGECLAHLRSRARRAHAATVQFPGRIEQADLPAYFAAADIFLNGDLGNPAFGLTNAEALCFGTPVFATPSGAHREVVRDDGDGWIVPMEKDEWPMAFRRILPTLPENPRDRAARARRARRRFARRRMIERLLDVYGHVAKWRRPQIDR